MNRGAKGFALAAALLPLVALPTAGAAAVPPLPTPATVLTLSLIPGSYDDAVQGSLCTNNPGNTCVPVDYSPLFFPSGVPALDQAIDSTSGQKIVFGYSQGGQVAQEWLALHAADPDAPSAEDLSFVLLGNATRKYGGANVPAGVVLEDTQYQVIDVARQYDYAVDFPDDPSNLLALANALAGFGTIHLTYRDVDIYDPANTVWKEGNITYVFVPTKNLPLLEPLRWLGLSELADQLNGPLKEIVERAYVRSYLTTAEETPAPPTPAADSARSVTAVSNTAVDPPPGTAPIRLANKPTASQALAETGPAKVKEVEPDARTVPSIAPSAPSLEGQSSTSQSSTSASMPQNSADDPVTRTTKPINATVTRGNKVVPGNAATKVDAAHDATSSGATSSSISASHDGQAAVGNGGATSGSGSTVGGDAE